MMMQAEPAFHTRQQKGQEKKKRSLEPRKRRCSFNMQSATTTSKQENLKMDHCGVLDVHIAHKTRAKTKEVYRAYFENIAKQKKKKQLVELDDSVKGGKKPA
jgi:hypothetical protein